MEGKRLQSRIRHKIRVYPLPAVIPRQTPFICELPPFNARVVARCILALRTVLLEMGWQVDLVDKTVQSNAIRFNKEWR